MINKESVKNSVQGISTELYNKCASENENLPKVLKEMDREYSDILKEQLAEKQNT